MSLLPGAVPYRLEGLPGGVDGIRATLHHMVRIVREYKKHGGIVTLARQIIENVSGAPNTKNYAPYVRALFEFVRDRIRYVRDIQGVETLQTPIRTLEIRAGDCDDKSILLASLLASIGLTTRFVALGFNNGPYSHVLVEVRLGKKWMPLDTIVDDKPPGWMPPKSTRFMRVYV